MRQLGKKYKIDSELRVSKNNIKHDTFDKTLWNKDLKNSSDEFEKSVNEYSKDYKPFRELNEDLFFSLYKYSPEKFKKSEIDYEYLLNGQVMDEMMETPEYKDLRSTTRLNIEFSFLATQILSQDSKKIVEKYREEAQKLADQLKELEDQINGAGKPEEQGDQDDQEDSDGNGQASKKLTLEEAKKLYEEKYDELQKIVPRTERANIIQGLKKAKEQAAEVQDFLQSFGLEQNNEFIRSSYQDKLKLLDRLRNSSKLKKIAKLSGKYKRMAVLSQREKIRKGNNEFINIEIGNDLNKIIPLEYLKFLDDDLNAVFLKNYVENSLLQSEFGIRERKQQGPIVCCIDSSGSMSGEAEIWSKAVAMGLLEICKIQKRSFVAIHFDSSRKESLPCQEFPHGTSPKPDALLEMAETFLSGGTAFEPPLELARDKIMQEKAFEKADIVFITDGESVVRDSWLKDFLAWKKEKAIKVHSILITVDWASDATLKEFSDSITLLKNIREDSGMEELAMNLFISM